jgi:hypothetical protein
MSYSEVPDLLWCGREPIQESVSGFMYVILNRNRKVYMYDVHTKKNGLWFCKIKFFSMVPVYTRIRYTIMRN